MAGRTDLDEHQEALGAALEGPSGPGALPPQAALRRPGAPTGALKPEQLRILLSHLQTPHRLDTPTTRQLLARHRRLPSPPTPQAVGAAAARLLTDKIAALDPGPDAPPAQRLPHRVLETCFVRARKSFQAAPELGISERQLSRERARAVALLAAELASPAVAEVAPLGLPKASGSVRRDPLPRQLSEALATHRRVAVTGATGSGKTTLVSALAHALGPETAWWYRIRPGVNDTLGALLYELGHALAREGFGPLRESLARNGRQGDVGAATRLALEGLAGRRRLLVLDDFDAVRGPRAIEGFLEEVLERLPLVSVVTIGRALPGAAVLEVPPFNDSETAQLLAGLPQARGVRRPLHDLTHGHPATLGAVASWWRGEPRGLQKLERALDAREPLTNLATLTSFALRS